MHPNPAYRPSIRDENIALACESGFGMLAVSAADGPPMLSHIPFLLAEDGSYADLHLVRSNPIARAPDAPLPARLAIQGPHSYVSPDWYGIGDQVPTWNYLAIHLTGTLAPLPAEDLPDLLARLSTHFEERLAPKPVWTLDKMTPGVIDKMLRQIAPFRLSITDVDATWKLAQNKPDAVRHSAADHLETYGLGQEIRLLAAMMRQPPQG